MKVPTAARYLDVSPSMVRRLLEDPINGLPSVKVDSDIRIPRAALDAYVARRMALTAATPDPLPTSKSSVGTRGDTPLSLAQAAKFSNISLSLWKRWDVERRLPTFRPARNVVRIPATFVSRIAAGHPVPPPGAYPRPLDPRGKALTVPQSQLDSSA